MDGQDLDETAPPLYLQRQQRLSELQRRSEQPLLQALVEVNDDRVLAHEGRVLDALMRDPEEDSDKEEDVSKVKRRFCLQEVRAGLNSLLVSERLPGLSG